MLTSNQHARTAADSAPGQPAYDALARRATGVMAKLGRRADGQAPHATAQQLVANLFFAPLLEEMRKLPFGKQFGGGGRGEEVFGEQLDNQVAAAAAASDPGGVVKHVAKWIDRLAGRDVAAEPAHAAQELRSAGADRATWPTALAMRAASSR